MADPMSNLDVLVVGTDAYGLDALGKTRSELFFPIFAETVTAYGARAHVFPTSSEFFRSSDRYQHAVLVLIFNESCFIDAEARGELSMIIEVARRRSASLLICNAPESGLIMGDKRTANRELTAAGVPMPAEVTAPTGRLVFSNAPVGSGETVRVTATPDPAQYNVEFVDTTQTFEGVDYYVCLRAMAVGPLLGATFVRARPVSEGTASVHIANTPPNPKLLNFLYATVAAPRQAAIVAICRAAGTRLGLGFYAHDLLPPRGRDDVLLCETGFKFDDFSARDYLGHLRADLVASEHLGEGIVRHYALLFLAQVSRWAEARPRR
jgi:hypothetical protein